MAVGGAGEHVERRAHDERRRVADHVGAARRIGHVGRHPRLRGSGVEVLDQVARDRLGEDGDLGRAEQDGRRVGGDRRARGELRHVVGVPGTAIGAVVRELHQVAVGAAGEGVHRRPVENGARAAGDRRTLSVDGLVVVVPEPSTGVVVHELQQRSRRRRRRRDGRSGRAATVGESPRREEAEPRDEYAQRQEGRTAPTPICPDHCAWSLWGMHGPPMTFGFRHDEGSRQAEERPQWRSQYPTNHG